MKLVTALRRYPATEDFVYLRPAPPLTPGGCDPYALRVVPFAALRGDPVAEADYYTLSIRGLTHFVDGANAEFTTLDQWERELQLFAGLRQLPIFRQHRTSKAFTNWRRAVAATKAAKARAALAGGGPGAAGGLFALSPAFQSPLRLVWGLCCDVAALRLHALTAGRVSTLPEFAAAHEEAARAAVARLATIRSEALRLVKGACAASLEALELQLQSFAIKQVAPIAGIPGGAAAGEGGSAAATGRGGGGLAALGQKELQLVLGGLGGGRGAAARLAALTSGRSESGGGNGGGAGGGRDSKQEFAYTIAAARRAEQRRLLSFIRLVDAMLADALRTLLVSSTAELLQATQPPSAVAIAAQKSMGRRPSAAPPSPGPAGQQLMTPQLQQQRGVFAEAGAAGQPSLRQRVGSLTPGAINAVPPTPGSSGAAAAAGKAPLFMVEVVLEGEEDALSFQPAVEEFKSHMAEVLAGFTACIASVERLYSQDSLVRVVVGASEADLEDTPTPLQDLVVGPDYEELAAGVRASLDAGFDRATQHVSGYLPFRDMVLFDRMLDVAQLRQAFLKQSASTALAASEAGPVQGAPPAEAGTSGNAPPGAGSQEAAPTAGNRSLSNGNGLAAEALSTPIGDGPVTLETFDKLLGLLAGQAADMGALPAHQDVGAVRVDAGRLKASLLPWPERRAAELREMLLRLAGELLHTLLDHIHAAAGRLSAPCGGVEDYATKLGFLARVTDQEAALTDATSEVRAMYALLESHRLEAAAEDRAAFAGLEAAVGALRALPEELEAGREAAVAQYAVELEAGLESVTREVANLRAAAASDALLSLDTSHAAAVDELKALQDSLTKQAAEIDRINGLRRTLRLPESGCDDLRATTDEAALKLSLWEGRAEFAALTDVWRGKELANLDVTAIEDTASRFHRAVARMERGLPPNALVQTLRADVDSLRQLLPLVAALRNPALKERHWARAAEAVAAAGGARLEPGGPKGAGITLQALVDAGAAVARDAVATISAEASQEAALEEMLAKVVAKWAGIELTVVPYQGSKDVFILGTLDDVQTALEDSLVAVSTILSSRFVSGIRGEVERVERQLSTFSDTMDQWVQVQRSWLYLEPIFTAPDIQKQLPAESKAFDHVHRQLKEVMRRIRERPNALQTAANPNLLESLSKSFQTLEAISKSLEEYLETKRVAFPRFYFLSNDELLEILAQGKNAQAVQPHISKCFDGVRRLEFGGDDPRSAEILALISGEGEVVSLGKSAVKARGGVEAWLGQVEGAMMASLRRLAKAAVASYPEEDRTAWVTAPHTPAQLVIAISQAYWCSAVEERLGSADPAAGLAELAAAQGAQLADLARLVRGELAGLARRSLAALVTIDVHTRDIVAGLAEKGASSVSAFEWQVQLRHYWESDGLVLRQVDASFAYGNEYLGAQPRLVVTPMTDRCYLTLTGALALKLGGSPAGPAGTGKTETVKDLAKALGINCLVFNCGENLDYKFMGKFFAGIAQSGAWACFDEFNRINVEVLSVVAQQLLVIQSALRAESDRFWFEGRPIRLVPTCGVFITMNPGYAGRAELPDNLKALFRPVAMMIPDYALVAEVMLLAEGFEASRVLAGKMVRLYRLASEQLSQQDHYDFGLRAVKSVLVMAGALRRAAPDLPEDVVLIRAMRDANLPKFLARDVGLFNAIIGDLFPGVAVPEEDCGELEGAICGALAAAGLQQPPAFVAKALQLQKTFDVRFGVMLVGPTGGGKTACYRALQQALTDLRAAGHPNARYQAVHTHVLNPKAIGLGELYGQYNLLTNEWTDGLASALIRAAVAMPGPDHNWVVFDGPVDALWIESMNTVLDDNCTLCLPNGERIKLPAASMRMLFEVADLAAASPATVSRCGMVYVAPAELGWRPLVQSWVANNGPLAKAAPELSSAQRGAALALFETHVGPGLAWLRRNAKEHLPAVDSNRVATLIAMLQSLLDPTRGFRLHTLEADAFDAALGNLFAFCYVWTLGGNLTGADSRAAFDAFAREQLAPAAEFPGAGLVFDYQVAPLQGGGAAAQAGAVAADASVVPAGCELRPWADSVPAFAYKKDQPFFEILVPTTDTVCYSALLELCLGADRPALFCGPAGVGKSVVTQAALTALSSSSLVPPAAGASKLWAGAAAAHTGREVAASTLVFSARTNSLDTQLLIEGRLEKKRKNRYGAPAGKRAVFFVDDVNMPSCETYGAQPPIELLRQLLDFGGVYDRKGLFWKEVVDTVLCAACGPPGGGRQEVTPRFLRHFTLLAIPALSEPATRSILGAILGGFLAEFPPELRAAGPPLVAASVEAYARAAQELLPTPEKSHYTFNLRDLSKVVQGVLMAGPRAVTSRDQLARLWLHEMCRVFNDRLTCEEDRTLLRSTLVELAAQHGLSSRSLEDVFAGPHPLMWGDFINPTVDPADRRYEEIGDAGRLSRALEDHLEDYNSAAAAAGGGGALNLVFFREAIEHVARTARVLRMPRGSALLVGVGGSGKQSLAKFAARVCGCELAQVELVRGYGQAEFREDLKKAFRKAGVEGRQVAFLLPDSKIVDEGFLEDVNLVLNSGEVSGMFAPEEKEAVVGDMREWVASRGLNPTRDGCWAAFIERVRDNLHLVLTMSPVGDAFRSRCRAFPSLINCTAIDWFNPWPAEALVSVAGKFLEGTELGGQQVTKALAEMCVELHTSVEAATARFKAELRRHYYTTPKSYLDMIALYLHLLGAKREEQGQARDRLLNGVRRLQDTNATVEEMRSELAALQPELAAKAAASAELTARIDKDQGEAEKVKAVVEAEAADVSRMQAATQAIADEARADLEEAMPALEAALDSLKALNKNDIVEIKSFAKPPVLVQMTLEAVCILKQEKPDWDTAKRILGDVNFMRSLEEFDKDAIPEGVVRRLKRYIDDPTFTPEAVAKQSKAAMSLCMWVRAMDVYHRVSTVVAPKREKLRQAQQQLDAADAALAQKQEALRGVVERVEGLKRQLADAQAEQKRLNEQAELTRKRLERAGKLTSGLVEEGVRWGATAAIIDAAIKLLVGDAFLAAGCIAYLGAFTGPYRDALLAQWVAGCQARGIPVSPGCTLRATLATPVEVREWLLAGLPSDGVSIDNAILATRCRRWPLMVDPQGQANAWVRALEACNGLRVLKPGGDTNLLRSLENCVRVGNPVLIEDVGEALDPALEPLLTGAVFKQGGRTLIRLGDADIDYDPAFKLYITTKLSNPHYLPEVCIRVTLINFTVTMQGLEDQLLGEVVRFEREELEAARDRLVVSIAADKRQLQDLEDRILRLLRECQGNILDDEQLIAALNSAKLTSGAIQARVREAEETERSINAARESYRPAATRGSVLYFATADLAAANPMYQTSLAAFSRMFRACLRDSEASEDVATRLRLLCDHATGFVFRTVGRGLYEAHKRLFGFLMAAAIARHPSASEISDAEWGAFLRGPPAAASGSDGGGGSSAAASRPRPAWVAEAVWRGVGHLEAIAPVVFKGLAQDMAAGATGAAWRQWYESDAPHLRPLPGDWDVRLPQSAFARLLLLRSMREESLTFACSQYVAARLGPDFTEPAPWTLDEVFQETAAHAPIILILSTGADPTAALQRFGERRGWALGGRLHLISLGQGQGPLAESILKHAATTGDWVCLQNCHLAKSWMGRLEERVEELGRSQQASSSAAATGGSTGSAMHSETGGGVHPDFRLWLTSMPSQGFPVSVLQAGLKLALEPPCGVRASLARSYAEATQESLESCPARPAEWRRLLYCLSFFHAVVQERRRFGPLGWNVSYDFSAADLDCASATLRAFLDRADTPIPWTALRFIIGEITYGGRVTDDLDRRCLAATLRRYLAPAAAEADGFLLAPAGRDYVVPPGAAGLDAVREHIRALPSTELPEVFGLHPTASLRFNLQEARRLLDSVLLVQPRAAAGGGGGPKGSGGSPAASSDQIVGSLAAEILAGLPEDLDVSEAAPGLLDHLKGGSDHETADAPSSSPADAAEGEAGVSPAGAADATASRVAGAVAEGQSSSSGGGTGLSSSGGGAATPPMDGLAVVLWQEVERFAKLAGVLRSTLTELQRGIKGQVVMSAELEAMYQALLANRVPDTWAHAAYPSLKPLASWVADYAARVAFVRSWLTKGLPACFWLPGLFFPQGFMTAVLQTHARRHGVPIDALDFGFEVQKQERTEGVVSPPPEGVYVGGLWLEGARWDGGRGCLDEPAPGEPLAPLPVVHFRPQRGTAAAAAADSGCYACPLYKTSARAGVLSTTGQSTNFVLCVSLPLRPGTGPDHWVLRGAALLCSRDD